MNTWGTIVFYSEQRTELLERVYNTIDGRNKMIENFAEKHPDGYYHILPFFKHRVKKLSQDEIIKPISIVRHKAVYNNIPTYNYEPRAIK